MLPFVLIPHERNNSGVNEHIASTIMTSQRDALATSTLAPGGAREREEGVDGTRSSPSAATTMVTRSMYRRLCYEAARGLVRGRSGSEGGRGKGGNVPEYYNTWKEIQQQMEERRKGGRHRPVTSNKYS